MNFKKEKVNVTADRILVETLLQTGRFHEGLEQFRLPDEQQKAMLHAFRTLDVDFSIAYVGEIIVGYTLILPPEPDERWVKMLQIRVLGAIEVIPTLRNKGVASQLLKTVLQTKSYEKEIIISLEYRWHWDLESVDGDSGLYKELLQKLLYKGGFEEILTNDPDIASYPENFMMARIGREIESEDLVRFFELAGTKNKSQV
ncbi:GNAT family N-acetyltransferase [Bacillus sp. FJAT-45037]|uniref:GNAT family N-acetyltransferase n=1 Tax=Bacillus sp. FJAT-45037 TaxID=2011007 RepID=UPI000C24888F|nr:GNAT family N-acetyltransferase [Bacillus sp. FJAT-45037]